MIVITLTKKEGRQFKKMATTTTMSAITKGRSHHHHHHHPSSSRNRTNLYNEDRKKRNSSDLFGNNTHQNHRYEDVAIVRNRNREDIYIPPAKRRQLMMEEKQRPDVQPNVKSDAPTVRDDSEPQHHHDHDDNDPNIDQKRTWDEQQRVIHGTINRLNSSTIKPLIHDLFEKVNLVRLRGVLARSVLLAAVSSIKYSPVYAALIAVLNTKLPEIGELIVHRCVLLFRKYYRQRNKLSCVAIVTLFGHLFHQSVVHELIILQILTVLLENPTDDSVEVAIHLLNVTAYTLLEVSPVGVRGVFERLRALLHEGMLSHRIVIQLEELFKMRKTGFVGDDKNVNPYYPPIPPELDLVEAEDQITFDEIMLDDDTIEQQKDLDTYETIDTNQFIEDELEWTKIRNEVLGIDEDDNDDDDDGENETDDDADDIDNNNDDEVVDTNQETGAGALNTSTALTTTPTKVQDLSENDLVHLRRTIYLTIMSSATYEECAHKLSKMDIPVGREEELINMIIECCSQERTFIRYYGLISSRFCLLDDRWRNAFISSFVQQYNTIHRLETNKLRNVAKLFAHLLHSDSIPWSVLNIIHLNEDETTSSSRIFIKIILQEIAEQLGMKQLLQRFETTDPTKQGWYSGMFPKDIASVRNTKYAINFFTSIGLGPLTDGLREFVKNAPRLIMEQQQRQLEQQKAQEAEQAIVLAKKKQVDDDDDSSTTTSSSSSSDNSSSSSSSDSSSSTSRSSSSSSSTYSNSSSNDDDSSIRSNRKKYRSSSRHSSKDIERRGRRDDRDRTSSKTQHLKSTSSARTDTVTTSSPTKSRNHRPSETRSSSPSQSSSESSVDNRNRRRSKSSR